MIFKRFLLDREYAVQEAESGAELPADFHLGPGNYTIGGVHFDMSAEGYYVYLDGLARVTHRRAVTNANALNLVSAFTWASVYGVADLGLSNAERNAKATKSKVSLQCNDLVAWIGSRLAAAGIASRIVRLITAETPNDFNDGHASLEVMHNGAWAVVDPSIGLYFTAANTPLSLRDLIPRVATRDFTERRLADYDRLDTATHDPALFDVTALIDLELRTRALQQNWMQRVWQIPGIDGPDGLIYFYMPHGTQHRQAWLEALAPQAFRVISEAEWNEKFYG